MLADIYTGARLGLKYGPTIRAGIIKANQDPEIVAAWKAMTAAVAEFHSLVDVAPVAPAPMEPAIPAQAVIAELQKQEIGPKPEGPDNPQL